MKIQEFKKVSKSIIDETKSLNAVVKCVNSILSEYLTINDKKLTLYGWLREAGVPLTNGKLSVKQLMPLLLDGKSQIMYYRNVDLMHHATEFECVQYEIDCTEDLDGNVVRPWLETYTYKERKGEPTLVKVRHLRKVCVKQWSVRLLMTIIEQRIFKYEWERKFQKSCDNLRTFSRKNKNRIALTCKHPTKKDYLFHVGWCGLTQEDKDMGYC